MRRSPLRRTAPIVARRSTCRRATPIARVGRVQRSARTRAKSATAAAWLAWLRGVVFARSVVCQLCGEAERSTPHEMHEVVSRARTRGLPPWMRFNPWNCCRLCRECHADVTDHRVDVVFMAPDHGADGALLAQRRLPGLHRDIPRYVVPAEAGTAALALWRTDHPGQGGPDA